LVTFRFVLLALLFSTLALPCASVVFGSEATLIRHIIVIMQENHSFDNYFGTYPSANGSIVNAITARLHPVDGLPDNVCIRNGMTCYSPYLSNVSNPINPVEGQITYEQDYAAGKMDGFVTYSGPQSMAYFDYHQIAAYWDYAEEYGLADRYFASALSTTTPNRLFLLAGDSPVANNYGPPPYVNYNQTILGQLDAHGVSWGYFDFVNAFGLTRDVYPLNYLTNAPIEGHVEDVSRLFGYLNAGTGLPAVSFVNALGSDTLNEHAPQNVTRGELWTVSVVNAVMSSAYWNSSAILITWDEGGGYYDHVAPPQLLKIDHGFAHPLSGYGQRVPLLVISAYAKENYVSDTVLNHMSIVRFIEYNWNLPVLNDYVMNSNNLLEFFNFTAAPRLPVLLSETSPFSATTYPIPLQAPSNQTWTTSISPGPSSFRNFPTFSMLPAMISAGVLLLWVSRRIVGRTSNS